MTRLGTETMKHKGLNKQSMEELKTGKNDHETIRRLNSDEMCGDKT